MDNGDRLRVVLKRLLEEMGYYDEEYDRWIALAHDAGLTRAEELIGKARDSLRSGSDALKEAMESIP